MVSLFIVKHTQTMPPDTHRNWLLEFALSAMASSGSSHLLAMTDVLNRCLNSTPTGRIIPRCTHVIRADRFLDDKLVVILPIWNALIDAAISLELHLTSFLHGDRSVQPSLVVVGAVLTSPTISYVFSIRLHYSRQFR